MSELEKRFQQFLDGELSGDALHQFEMDILNDEEMSKRYASALAVRYDVENSRQVDVPNWDRSSTFDLDVQPWWQWSGLPVTSMAFSMCAMLMVMLNVSISSNENGFSVSFGDKSQQQQQMVDRRIEEVLVKQDRAFVDLASQLQQQQQDQQLQMVSYLMTTSREERKEDISDLIRYINSQRNEDYDFMQGQVRQLQRTIYSSDEQPLVQSQTIEYLQDQE